MEEVSSTSMNLEKNDVKGDLSCDIPAPSETDQQGQIMDNSREAETSLGPSDPVDSNGDVGLSFPLQRLPPPSTRPKSDFEEGSQLSLFGVSTTGPQRTGPRSQRYSLAKNPDDFPEPGTWKERLYQYCQGASIHGLKQITEPHPVRSRRVMWLILLLLGLTFFIYQMYEAISYYNSWPVSVNIDIKYNDSIHFPAVTLCNQNAFRVSAAKYYDHYDLTTEFYINPRTVNLSAYPTAEQHYITDLYTLAGHRRDGLFVECFWDSSPCEDRDIVVTLTDFGVCYTFNSGIGDREIKYAVHTGSQSGLQLRLNIEQYEYMRGPNTGAGIKLHLHNQGDVALVKDQGIAVAPGTHGFVALDILKIHNLGPPHGRCESDVKLNYYDKYTTTTCAMDCLQHFVITKCGCRDFYMPLANTTVPMCTLKVYQDCLIPAYDAFNEQKTVICSCPNPCDVTVFDPSVSYASTSNFDTDAMLQSSSPVDLQTSFINAREATQRVNKDIVHTDTMLINSFTNIVHNFTELFNRWNATLAYSRSLTYDLYRKLQIRHGFHSRMALGKMKYVIRHEFIRGWEVAEERAIRHVTDNFYDLVDSFDHFVEFANASDSEAERRAAWFYVENALQGRGKLALRSIDNITEAYESFTQGIRLVNYKSTIEERYDQSYAATSVLLGEYSDDVKEYYDGMINGLQSFKESLDTLISLGQTFVNSSVLDTETLTKCQVQLIEAAKDFNYDMFRFSDRIVHGSLERVQKKVDEFETAWLDIEQAFSEMSITLTDTESMVWGIRPLWQLVQMAAQEAKLYLRDTSKTKTNLAKMVTGDLVTFIDSVQIFLRDLRSNARIQTEKWYRWEHVTKVFWQKMLFETSLSDFYQMVFQDLQSYLNADSILEKMRFAKLLYWMLEDDLYAYPVLYRAEDLLNLTEDELSLRLNTEVYTVDMLDMDDYVHGNFSQHFLACNLAIQMGASDEILLKVVSEFIQDMEEFLEGNKIDVNFYRENFLRVDVYLKNLRYQEITQQKDYDLQKLLSDIGGSVGLFIGASVLSIFEFLDIIIFHPMLRR